MALKVVLSQVCCLHSYSFTSKYRIIFSRNMLVNEFCYGTLYSHAAATGASSIRL